MVGNVDEPTRVKGYCLPLLRGLGAWTALVVAATDCTGDVATPSAAVPLIPETCLAPPGLAVGATLTWPTDPLPAWEQQALVPDTLCKSAPGAWFASSPVGSFEDAADASGNTVALLHRKGILRVDGTGKPVQAVNLETASAGVERFCPAAQGGWFVLGKDMVDQPSGGTALLRVTDDGEVAWTWPSQTGRYLLDCTATVDGGVIIGGAQNAPDTQSSYAFWQHVNAQGVASPEVPWSGVGAVNDLLFRQDGSLCAGGGYWPAAKPGREVMVACWQGTSQLWARVVEEPALDDLVALSAWPDGKLLATVRSLRWGPHTQTVVAVDASGQSSQTFVPQRVTGYFGNQGSKIDSGHASLSAVQPLPCMSIGYLHMVPRADAKGSDTSWVWERRTLTGTQRLVRLDAEGNRRKASAISGLFGGISFVNAALQRPDGSLWIIGGQEKCAGSTPGSWCGWVYRLPALTACPAGSAVPP